MSQQRFQQLSLWNSLLHPPCRPHSRQCSLLFLRRLPPQRSRHQSHRARQPCLSRPPNCPCCPWSPHPLRPPRRQFARKLAPGSPRSAESLHRSSGSPYQTQRPKSILPRLCRAPKLASHAPPASSPLELQFCLQTSRLRSCAHSPRRPACISSSPPAKSTPH